VQIRNNCANITSLKKNLIQNFSEDSNEASNDIFSTLKGNYLNGYELNYSKNILLV
jgi:hypothetical protein